jgi:hypothetical protein
LFQIWFHIELFLITNPTVPRLHFSDIFFYAKVYFYFFIRKKKFKWALQAERPSTALSFPARDAPKPRAQLRPPPARACSRDRRSRFPPALPVL